METDSLNQMIKKAFDYYDNIMLSNQIMIKSNDILLVNQTNEITFNINKKTFNYEILGYFDNNNLIWIWSWLLPQYNSTQTKIARELLNYGLKLEPESNVTEHIFIKSLLVNSRVSIEDSIQLDTNLAIYSYLSPNKFKFIYPHKIYMDENNKNYITLYYLIK
jgi:hypothetical protein